MANLPATPSFFNPQMHHVGYQGAVEGSSNLREEGSATLLIKHLPDAIPHDTLSRLFSHYGASAVRPGTSGRLKNCAFVDFKNEALASQAQRQLHGLRFLGKVLFVERAKKRDENTFQTAGGQVGKDIISSQSLAKETSTIINNCSASKIGILPAGEPIATKLGIDYPFPPHLEYAYPPPDGNILTNIVNALIAVPRFYTQVLHLMNKMNIPAPFRMALQTPPLPPSVPVPLPPPPPLRVEKPHSDLSSDESEMESSDEDMGRKSSSVKPARKRMKRESIVGPAVDKDVAHEAVGLKPATLVPKEMPMIKKKNPMLQIKITQKQVQTEPKDEHITDAQEETNEECPAAKPYASAEDLDSGKLPPEEILSLPMFKNYSAGNPAPVLYIKNLSKDVVPDDFYFIFGSIFGDLEMVKSSLTVKLMQVIIIWDT
uniref:RRM domain-containing protein n=1 Tax=Kalanchoe fedtschenkoi TaxID=63787 RepID=A0A7N0ZWM2_KALFE